MVSADPTAFAGVCAPRRLLRLHRRAGSLHVGKDKQGRQEECAPTAQVRSHAFGNTIANIHVRLLFVRPLSHEAVLLSCIV
jgi:hypothetical protein